MADQEAYPVGAKRYCQALVLAYRQMHKPVKPKALLKAQPKAFSKDASPQNSVLTPFQKPEQQSLSATSPDVISLGRNSAETRQALLKELTSRINLLERQLKKLSPVGEMEKKKIRKLETKIDILRAKLEVLKGTF